MRYLARGPTRVGCGGTSADHLGFIRWTAIERRISLLEITTKRAALVAVRGKFRKLDYYTLIMMVVGEERRVSIMPVQEP